MIIYIMRHGTTVWNEKGITQGRSQNRLSKSGKTLVQNVANEFKNVKFDAIVSSPLMRTMQTANIMNNYHNVKIFKDNNLIEIDQGIFTRKDSHKITKEEQEIKNKRLKEYGMETYLEALNRSKEFFNSLKQKYNYETLLIVTHNGIASLLEALIKNSNINLNSPSCIRQFNNAEVKMFKI